MKHEYLKADLLQGGDKEIYWSALEGFYRKRWDGFMIFYHTCRFPLLSYTHVDLEDRTLLFEFILN